jgi:hypothetical protein
LFEQQSLQEVSLLYIEDGVTAQSDRL